jgi:selenocysteine lyase/cysteine desulfurase
MTCGSDALRALFPHTSEELVYFDHASIGPLSTRVVAALQEHIMQRSAGSVNTYPRDIQRANECRVMLGRLINAESPERIAFCMNTSDALNVVAAGLHLRSGDVVLLNDAEFPSNVYPFLNLRASGVQVDMIDALQASDGAVSPEVVEDALKRHGGRVKVVSLSAVQFLSGFRADLAAIGALCRSYGAVFVVDAIQALGAVPIDVQAMSIDALAAGGQKWLMSTTGIAFLYMSAALQERVQQPTLGWTSVQTPWDFFNYDQPLAATARRYENGTLNFAGIIALTTSVETLLELGIEHIEAHLRSLTDVIVSGLQGMDEYVEMAAFAPKHRAGIVSARLKPSADKALSLIQRGDALQKELAERKVIISSREGRLRFSPHCYNTADEVQSALHAMREVLQS